MVDRIGVEFMRKSRPAEQGPSDQSRGLPQPPLELPYDPTCPLIKLPDPHDLQVPDMDLRKAIERRRTERRYSDQPLTLDQLTFLLWTTQGVQAVTPRPATQRNVPSAGARHAFETYLLVNRVNGLESGLYRYLAVEHALILIEPGTAKCELMTQACQDQRHILTSAVTFVWVAVTERMTWRYNLRGYRYLHLDAGHVCQNLYLSAEAIDCRMCAIAAFDDQAVNDTLNIDGESQFVIYLASLGKRRE